VNRIEGRNVTVWDRETGPDWRGGCLTILAVAAIAFGAGYLVGSASRPAQVTSPQPGPSASDDRQVPTGMTLSPTVALIPSAPAITSPEPTETPLSSMRLGTSSPKGNTASHSVSGVASWYAANGLIAAAGPALRKGDWRGRVVTIRGRYGPVRIRLTDWCQCYGTRIIDLSDDAVRALGFALSAGVYRVTVTW
jgi:rare lipoprotein A (peptidoglycan hydrolase)